jgi:hypothetical protein
MGGLRKTPSIIVQPANAASETAASICIPLSHIP